jgi:hypothetical protein
MHPPLGKYVSYLRRKEAYKEVQQVDAQSVRHNVPPIKVVDTEKVERHDDEECAPSRPEMDC